MDAALGARILADALLVVHLAFIVFAALGGIAAIRWPAIAWLHLPAAAWAVMIEFTGWICPLTPLEVALRRSAGQPGYDAGFIEHYLTAIIYPQGLTRGHQIAFGVLVLIVNVLAYARIVARHRRTRLARDATTAGLAKHDAVGRSDRPRTDGSES